jgi:cell division protein FtsA
MEHPVGMPGRRLDASAFVLYTNRIHAETVEQAVNRAAIVVQQLAYEPLAAAAAVIDDDERDLGCLVIDIGFASTEWVLTADKSVVASGAVPVGGRHFTADLAAMLKTTSAAAEHTKRTVGASRHRDNIEGEAVEVPALGCDGNQVHAATFVVDVLVERGRDLFIGIHRILLQSGLDKVPRAGVVLTGGGSKLEGLADEAESIFGHRVRLGIPRGLAGLTEPVLGPGWAVACGLLRLQEQGRDQIMLVQKQPNGVLTWLRNAFGEFFNWEVGHDRV